MGFINLLDFVVMFLIIVLIYKIFIVPALPLTPRDDLPQFEIQSINVSNFNISNDQIYAQWNINMNVNNYHSHSVLLSLSNITLSILNKNEDKALWMMSLNPFDMGPNSPRVDKEVDFSGSTFDVLDTTIRAIAKNVTDDGKVEFRVRFVAQLDVVFTANLVDYWLTDGENNHLVANCNSVLFFGSSDKRQGASNVTSRCNVGVS